MTAIKAYANCDRAHVVWQLDGRVGGGLREAAWADDGTLEAVEDPSKRFALGVLWHPEEDEDAALFEALVAEARTYREKG